MSDALTSQCGARITGQSLQGRAYRLPKDQQGSDDADQNDLSQSRLEGASLNKYRALHRCRTRARPYEPGKSVRNEVSSAWSLLAKVRRWSSKARCPKVSLVFGTWSPLPLAGFLVRTRMLSS